ncbi:MAG: YkgJ family cysteine cluster protein [Candidatus Gastranaerophilales bacterium]|nr:YkgJ family cysteine cluster protein [Candidatus Gastranaerophilales bacterium]
MEEISDGRLYGIHDMVKADCHDCVGCSQCCHDMVDTIILFPLDACRLSLTTRKPFAELVEREVALGVVDGVVLPHLKMTQERNCCPFLNEKGRCSIHAYRPDLCRLFPLGRYYEDGDFKYFLQSGQCGRPRTKVKVEKWIDTPDYGRNKEYLLRWHVLLNRVEEILYDSGDENLNKNLNLALLNLFYMTPYDRQADFYEQFAQRAERIEKVLADAE